MSVNHKDDELRLGTVLLVDDEPFILKILTDSLGTIADTLVTAVDGKDAIEKLETLHPDLIISDIMMPRLNGFDFLKQVRQSEKWKDIPFILLTVKDTAKDMLKGYGIGADYYLPKPFDMQVLRHAIRTAIAAHSR